VSLVELSFSNCVLVSIEEDIYFNWSGISLTCWEECRSGLARFLIHCQW